MDGCLESISVFQKLSKRQVGAILLNESSQFEVTRSLLNLLHNIVLVGSVPASQEQKKIIDKHADLVWLLLSDSKSLKWKRKVFADNIDLVNCISASCPTIAGS